MSFTIRFLDTSDGKVTIQEHFISFKTVDESTGEGLTDTILTTLKERDINIQDCQGQGYDNSANMKGKNKGVQVRILNQNPRAFFVPCECHLLNLVVGDAATSSPESISPCGILQKDLPSVLYLCSSLGDSHRSCQYHCEANM
ncbi:unnamed protein product [Lepidochelys kempii]